MLSRDEILAADDIKSDTVDVPEWGGQVRILAMSGSSRDAFEAAYLAGKKLDTRALMAAFSIVGDDDQPLFTPADVAALGAKSAAALDRVMETAARLGRLTVSGIVPPEDLAGPS